MKRQNRVFFTLLLTFLIPFVLIGQQAGRSVEVTLASPYNTMLVHLHYLQAETYEPFQAGRVFNGISDSLQAKKLAIQLKQILDGKGLFVRFNTIPTDSNYVDSLVNQAVYTPFPQEVPEIYLEKIGQQWFYSSATVVAIPELHKKVYPFGTDQLLNLVPKVGQQRFLGLMLWQWLGFLIIIGLSGIIYVILWRLLNPIIRRISSSKLYPSLIPKPLIRRVARLISILLIIRLLNILIPILQLSVEINTLIISILKLGSILIFALLGLRIIDVVMTYVDKFTKRTTSKMDEQLVPIMTRTLQGIILIIAIISALRLFNVNVTALIAGISIGGLAIALAAQDTIKNLFGSFMIFFDKPFQIGDSVSFNGVDGTIEEVGFRSTRVRTFANSLVYVPNGKLADSVIDNFGLRVYRRYKTNISLTYDTPPLLIEQFVEGLKGIVAHHPSTRKDAFEIHLNGMSANSLDILFYIFFDVANWNEELKARHEIIISTLQLAEHLGVRFAFPTSTIHVEEFPGNGKSSPSYQTEKKTVDDKLNSFLEDYKKRFTQ